MSTGARVGAFAALLVAIFLLAAIVGRAVDPDPGEDAHRMASAGEHGDHERAHAAAAPGGLAIAQDGYRLAADGTTRTAGTTTPFRFRIVDDAGDTVREFDTEQGKRMHLIVVRRDLRAFQHLHPVQESDGGWSVPLTLATAGAYRAFADFQSGGERRTLGVDLLAPGSFAPRELPRASKTAIADGYEVALHDAGDGALRFSVMRGNAPVDDLQPYLGAYGHLVVLREGDLAYAHVHPAGRGDRLAFEGAPAEPGNHRLFLQFRHADRVHTAAFTRPVGP